MTLLLSFEILRNMVECRYLIIMTHLVTSSKRQKVELLQDELHQSYSLCMYMYVQCTVIL